MILSERSLPSFPIMLVAMAGAGLCLAGCSSRPARPPLFEIQLESTPPGAEARTSFGPGCKTPCSVNAPLPDGNFAVTYTLEGFLPVTVPVAVTGSPAGDIEDRAQSGGRNAAAHRPAEAGQAATAKKAEERGRGTGPTTLDRVHPLIACTAQDLRDRNIAGLYGVPNVH